MGQAISKVTIAGDSIGSEGLVSPVGRLGMLAVLDIDKLIFSCCPALHLGVQLCCRLSCWMVEAVEIHLCLQFNSVCQCYPAVTCSASTTQCICSASPFMDNCSEALHGHQYVTRDQQNALTQKLYVQLNCQVCKTSRTQSQKDADHGILYQYLDTLFYSTHVYRLPFRHTNDVI